MESERKEITLVPLGQLKANSLNMYQVNDLELLAENIHDSGLLVPLIAVEAENAYVLISGHRRKAAMEILCSQNSSYSWYGEDITGKAPVIVTEDYGDRLQELRALLSANSHREMDEETKAAVIDTCEEILVQEESMGIRQTGRTADLIASMSGFSLNSVKQYLARKNRKSVEPDEQETRNMKKAYRRISKNINQLSMDLMAVDWNDEAYDKAPILDAAKDLMDQFADKLGYRKDSE